MTAIKSNSYHKYITKQLHYCLIEAVTSVKNPLSRLTCRRGKVRDVYELDDQLIMVTTDRHSSFDRHIATIPFKGQVLNQCSYWWFNCTKEIINNHLIALLDPNIMLVKKCRPLPIEVVVRGYITGSTDTSLWSHYSRGVREYCGNRLPAGLRKNQKLEQVIITPTTKEASHDRPLSPHEILSEGLISEKNWSQISHSARQLFSFGQKVAEKNGLLLVDTKYEFGLDENNTVILIDELHTPDSSRYWLKESYSHAFNNGKEPENFDKEFLRLWFRQHCDPYRDKQLPEAPQSLIIELSQRYIELYERITALKFVFPDDTTKSIEDRMIENLLSKRLLKKIDSVNL